MTANLTRWLAFVAVAGITAMLSATAAVRASPVPVLSPAQSDYLQNCGGCHGIEGRSLNRRVPDLAKTAGLFLCTSETRAYFVQLPNVAFAHMDSKKLAALVNFVAFGLGEGSAPAGAKPYTAAEVERLRAAPIDNTALVAMRARIVAQIAQRCPYSANLNAYAGGLN